MSGFPEKLKTLPKIAAELPKKAAGLPKKAAELPKIAAELPKKAAELPKKAAELPKKAAELPKKVAEATEKKPATPDDIMAARLFFNAAFPTMQVLLDDDYELKKQFQDFCGVVQFGAKNGDELLCCNMTFDNGTLSVKEGPAEKPDLTLTFPTVAKMNALLKGGLAMPAIKGNVKLLPKILSLLMGLKIMTKPNDKLKDEGEKARKVKCSLYMITRALSQYNKLGDPSMREFCERQPDRIYQFQVEHNGIPDYIAAYLRIKAGKSKSGHGIYKRRTPFVLFHFYSLDGVLKVLGKECEFVEGVEKGYVETVGSPEYALYLNDYMAILQAMLT